MSTEDRDTKGRFVNGGKPGPGRPLGARNKLGEAFLQALQEDFEQHGIEAIAECRKSKPEKYCSIVASLLPKEATLAVEVDINQQIDLAEFARDYRLVLEAARRIGAEPIMLEAEDSE